MMGLVLGIVPGIGGLAGTAMLLPFTFAHGPLLGVRAAARPRRDHRDRRSDPGDPVRRARRCRLRGNGARRLPDGQARRGRARAQRRLHVVDDGRHFRRGAAGGFDPDPAAGDALSRVAGAAGVFGPGHKYGCGAVGQRAAARRRRRLPRHHDRDDRLRPADRHAALDLRQPLSVGRPAADAGAARPVRAAGAVRPADRPHHDLEGDRQEQHLQGPVAGREGLLRELVADPALLLDRRRHRLDPRHQRLGGRLAGLRPRAARPRRARRRPSARATCAA